MRILLVAILLSFPLLAISQPAVISEKKDEVYEFKFDKSAAKERALKLFDMLDFPAGQPLFSSIKGQNCKGKPARYVIVLTAPPTRPDFPEFVVFDVSNPNKWSIWANGTGTALRYLVAQLRSPDFTSDIRCVGD